MALIGCPNLIFSEPKKILRLTLDFQPICGESVGEIAIQL
jgi:hypothetical protein